MLYKGHVQKEKKEKEKGRKEYICHGPATRRAGYIKYNGIFVDAYPK